MPVGPMTSSTSPQSQRLSRSSRMPKSVGEGELAGKKPKKANSEIRKQQNRIASRNYREKRKRKLQYLQQLIKDGPNDQQESEPSPEQHDAYARSLSVEYESTGPSSSPYMLPSNTDMGSFGSSSAAISQPLLTASGTSFDSHLLATSQAYPVFEPSWNVPLFSPPPPVSLPSWNVPSWNPSADFVPRIPSRPQVPYYITPSGPPVFAQAHAPQQHPQELLPNGEYYAFSSSFGSQSQASGIPNVSVPMSSPYYHGSYPGPC